MKKRQILKCVIFVVLFLTQCVIVSKWLMKPTDYIWYTNGLTDIYDKKNYYDVLFCGTSTAIANISNEELYLKYGISGISLGKPEQTTYLTYYVLEEALKYQSPKVVFFDVKSLFYSEETLKEKLSDEYYHLHYSLDEMKNNSTKYRAITQAQEIEPQINMWDYFLPLYYRHSNWEEITEENFDEKYRNHIMLDNIMLSSVLGNVQGKRSTEVIDIKNDGNEAIIPEINKKYLIKMIELCQQKEIQLVLLRGNRVDPWSWDEYNAVHNIAEKYSIPYIDINLQEDEVGMNWSLDLSDYVHHNIIGAKKWTDYLGKYLSDNFEFEDRREDTAYVEYAQEGERYNKLLDGMGNKILLLQGTDFDSYLVKLSRINKEENSIFVAIEQDGTAFLSGYELQMLSELGLEANLEGEYCSSYIALLDTEGKVEQLSSEAITAQGIFNQNISYELSSGGASSGISASIKINGQEMVQGGRGINIVVYNKSLGEVISSVFFDTCASKNPPTAQIQNVEVLQKQVETAENQWTVVTENE